MIHLDPEALLSCVSLHADDRLSELLSAAMHRRGLRVHGGVAGSIAPAWFGLDRVGRVRDAGPEAAREIAQRCTQSLLDEALYIEQVGVAFAARMSLLATSRQERSMYALFAADEASHLSQISAWNREPGPPSAFHAALATLVATADRRTLQFVVQIVLEGWGLRHYRALADATPDPELSDTLRRIVDDEAHHHGSGVLLFHRGAEDPTSDETILAALRPFLDDVRAGPTGVVAAIDAVIGDKGPAERATALAELDARAHATERLHLLASLMRGPRSAPILTALEAEGAFRPIESGVA
jgi:rubrerythrin